MNNKKIMWLLISMAIITLSAGAFLWYRSAVDMGMKNGATGPAPLAHEQVYTAGVFKVRAAIDPDPPRVGENRLSVWITDQQDQPVTGAELKIVAEMAAMGSMPAMQAPAEMRETGAGQYQGTFEPLMGGEWPLTIDIITKGAGSARLTLEMATGRMGLRCSSCGSASPDAEIPGTVHVDFQRRQIIGVTTREVRNKRLRYPIRATGIVAYDETRLMDITLKFDAWIGELYANYVGKSVEKGQPLFTVYGPMLLSAQEEYLESARRSPASGNQNTPLLDAAHRRLKLWGLSNGQIDSIGKQGRALEYIPILSPLNGIVIEKPVVPGSAVQNGQQLLRIADTSTMWVEGRVYEYELPMLKPGADALVTFPDIAGQSFSGKVSYISPYMDEKTRTATVRVEVDNPDGFLRADMYAEINIEVDLGKRLVVPEEAVLYSGEQRVVFLDLGDGRLQPRKIETGVHTERWIEIIDGLTEGDRVVASGNFLIASESKLKSGLAQW